MLLESAAITTIKQLPRPQSHGVRGKMNYWSAGQEMTTKVNPEPKAMGAVLFLYFQVRFFFCTFCTGAFCAACCAALCGNCIVYRDSLRAVPNYLTTRLCAFF